MKCLDKMASFLFYAVIVDFSLEVLDFIHRLYESEESIKILGQLITHKLFMSLVVLQILLGMLIPLWHPGASLKAQRFTTSCASCSTSRPSC